MVVLHTHGYHMKKLNFSRARSERNGFCRRLFRIFTLFLLALIVFLLVEACCSFVPEMRIFICLNLMTQVQPVLITFLRFSFGMLPASSITLSLDLPAVLYNVVFGLIFGKFIGFVRCTKGNLALWQQNYRGLQITSQLSKAMERFLGMNFPDHLAFSGSFG